MLSETAHASSTWEILEVTVDSKAWILCKAWNKRDHNIATIKDTMSSLNLSLVLTVAYENKILINE